MRTANRFKRAAGVYLALSFMVFMATPEQPLIVIGMIANLILAALIYRISKSAKSGRKMSEKNGQWTYRTF